MTSSKQSDSQVTVAMITGHHPYDVINFQRMLRSFPDIDFYPQHLEDFAQDIQWAPGSWTPPQYDVIAFYNYQQRTPRSLSEDSFLETKTATQ